MLDDIETFIIISMFLLNFIFMIVTIFIIVVLQRVKFAIAKYKTGISTS